MKGGCVSWQLINQNNIVTHQLWVLKFTKATPWFTRSPNTWVEEHPPDLEGMTRLTKQEQWVSVRESFLCNTKRKKTEGLLFQGQYPLGRGHVPLGFPTFPIWLHFFRLTSLSPASRHQLSCHLPDTRLSALYHRSFLWEESKCLPLTPTLA